MRQKQEVKKQQNQELKQNQTGIRQSRSRAKGSLSYVKQSDK